MKISLVPIPVYNVNTTASVSASAKAAAFTASAAAQSAAPKEWRLGNRDSQYVGDEWRVGVGGMWYSQREAKRIRKCLKDDIQNPDSVSFILHPYSPAPYHPLTPLIRNSLPLRRRRIPPPSSSSYSPHTIETTHCLATPITPPPSL